MELVRRGPVMPNRSWVFMEAIEHELGPLCCSVSHGAFFFVASEPVIAVGAMGDPNNQQPAAVVIRQ